jgi:hypothetical protein
MEKLDSYTINDIVISVNDTITTDSDKILIRSFFKNHKSEISVRFSYFSNAEYQIKTINDFNDTFNSFYNTIKPLETIGLDNCPIDSN